jgi:hypothetical protein
MGGKSSKEITKVDITNEIELEIVNETTNINKIVATTINETTMNVVNKVANDITNSTGGNNEITANAMVADGAGSIIDINQSISLDTINKAAIQVTSDVDAQTKLASAMAQDVANKTTNDSAMQASLQAAANLTSLQKDAGGIEKILGDVMKMASDFTDGIAGSKVSKEQHTTIKNTMKNSIKNVTINQNDIENTIKNVVNSTITQENMNTCKNSVITANKINIDGPIAARNGGKVIVKQATSIKALSECIIGSSGASKLGTDIVNTASTGTSSDTGNKNKTESELKATAEVSTTKIQEAALTTGFFDALKAFSPFAAANSMAIVCAIGCVVIALIAILFVFMRMMKSGGSSSEPTETSE